MTLKIGKLYSCSKYFLLIYPDKKTAAAADRASGDTAHAVPHVVDPAASAAYWTKKLQKPVSYWNTETPFLVLSVKEKYIEVLAGDKVGWAFCERWLEIKEITDAAA